LDAALHAEARVVAQQIECAFSILHAQVLARGSFASTAELREAIERYLLWFNAQDAAPFVWSYRPKSWDS